MDERHLNAFLVARSLIERAGTFIDGTAPGAIGAVVLFDLSIETAAKAADSARSPTDFPGDGYELKKTDLVKSPRGRELSVPRVLDHVLAAARHRANNATLVVPEVREAQRLHEFRNLVQHQGVVPSSDDLIRSRLRALDAVTWLASEFFGVPLAEFSRASLIHSAEVREQVEAAEKHAELGDYSSAVVHLTRAFELARYAFKTGEPYRPPLRVSDVRQALRDVAPKPTSTSHAFGGLRRLERLLEGVVRQVERLDQHVEALSLGARSSDYAWLWRRFERPRQGLSEAQEWYAHPPDPPATREEYFRALDFITTTALHWQQFPAPPPHESMDGAEGTDAPARS